MIAAESTLTYLGVGLPVTTISWGGMIDRAQLSYATSPHLLLFPSLALVVTTAGFVLLGDAIRDALDPRTEPSVSVTASDGGGGDDLDGSGGRDRARSRTSSASAITADSSAESVVRPHSVTTSANHWIAAMSSMTCIARSSRRRASAQSAAHERTAARVGDRCSPHTSMGDLCVSNSAMHHSIVDYVAEVDRDDGGPAEAAEELSWRHDPVERDRGEQERLCVLQLTACDAAMAWPKSA